MPPKKVKQIPQLTPEEVAKIEENEIIRKHYEDYKMNVRVAKDMKRDPPNMKSFARAASEDSRVSKNVEAVYAQFKRAQKDSTNVIGIIGRPEKGLDALQLHAFARKSGENVRPLFLLLFD